MSEAVEIVAALNSTWRVVVVPAARRFHRAWSLQRLVGDAWQGHAMARTAELLRGLVLAYAGAVDEAAAGILATLPPRVDFDAMISAEQRRKAAQARRRKRGPRVETRPRPPAAIARAAPAPRAVEIGKAAPVVVEIAAKAAPSTVCPEVPEAVPSTPYRDTPLEIRRLAREFCAWRAEL
ncbi:MULTISPECIES: hypothetical protein [Bradyrhizobium]|uniref:Uncharacterized protein n=1 Tax=Bradyrhizobium septentrionale TaxID=1404411 RepID=A0ABZ2P946_9BRAD